MNRSIKTLCKVFVALSFALALSATNIGCHHGCGKCSKSSDAPCGSGCTKPCCKKAEKT